jgi:hypothetical protein
MLKYIYFGPCKESNKIKDFVHGKLTQPIFKIANKAGAYLSEVPFAPLESKPLAEQSQVLSITNT